MESAIKKFSLPYGTILKKVGITEADYDEFVISETDKFLFFSGALKKDEVAIVGQNKDYIFSFNDRIPEIVSDIFDMEIQRPNSGKSDYPIDIEELKKALNANKFGNILIGKDCATEIDICWPEYCDVKHPSCNFKISSWPTSRKVPFIFHNSRREEVVDLLPVIKYYHKCITTDELVERLLKIYKDESEIAIRSKCGIKPIDYVR